VTYVHFLLLSCGPSRSVWSVRADCAPAGHAALAKQLAGFLISHGITDTRPGFDEAFETWWDGCRFTPEAKMLDSIFGIAEAATSTAKGQG
jgi:hypothetical protein